MCHCRASLEPGTALEQRITEKGVLQLLFDIRFLRDMLAGGRPPADGTTSDAAQEAAVAQRKAAFADLESGLQVTCASGILPQGDQNSSWVSMIKPGCNLENLSTDGCCLNTICKPSAELVQSQAWGADFWR